MLESKDLTLEGEEVLITPNPLHPFCSITEVKMKTIAIVLMFLFYPQKPDIRWFYLTSSEGESYYYDFETLTKLEYRKIRVWIKTEIKPKVKPVPKVHQAKILYEINCADETMRATQEILYGRNNKLLSSRSAPRAPWDTVVPETVGERMVETICKVAEKLP